MCSSQELPNSSPIFLERYVPRDSPDGCCSCTGLLGGESSALAPFWSRETQFDCPLVGNDSLRTAGHQVKPTKSCPCDGHRGGHSPFHLRDHDVSGMRVASLALLADSSAPLSVSRAPFSWSIEFVFDTSSSSQTWMTTRVSAPPFRHTSSDSSATLFHKRQTAREVSQNPGKPSRSRPKPLCCPFLFANKPLSPLLLTTSPSYIPHQQSSP